MIRVESPYTSRILILKLMASSIPRIHASYYSMLFVQVKHNLSVKGIWYPVRDVMKAPIPCPVAFEAPSNTNFHRDPGSGSSLGPGVSQSLITIISLSLKSNCIG